MPPETFNGTATLHVKTRQQWRKWLEKNCKSKEEVCLIVYHKSSKAKGIRYVEAVEEALCFGWIDSRTNKRGPDTFYQRFSPRKPASNWSPINKARVKRLKREGLMTEQGQRMIDIAKEKGKW